MLSNLINSLNKKRLPTGIQTFSKLREADCYYVDKTSYLIKLCRQETAVFLSRPRRFGKSLTIDTLAEMFSGNKALFEGLYAEDNWDWDTVYPVIRIGFTEGEIRSAEQLEDEIHAQLAINEENYQLPTGNRDKIHDRFRSLIINLAKSNNSKVVILIDEYDKPMVDNIDKDYLLEVRSVLRDLYSVIKGQDANLRFAMLTGVSKFSKVNVFSGLNSLTDITLMSKYSAICGYTQAELESVFVPELIDVDLDKMKRWYNGYNWSGESVYNPFDVLLFFANDKRYKPHWFQTGSPKWLVDNLVTNHVEMHDLESATYNDMQLADFDIDSMNPIAILFQTGYLTIDKVLEKRGVRYTLKYPNIEVQQSLNQVLLNRYINPKYQINSEQDKLFDYLLDGDYDNVKLVFQSFFASIPHQWYDTNKNLIAHYEGHWASVFYGFLTGLGVRIHTEDSTHQGRMDCWFEFHGTVYIIEFKVDTSSLKLNEPPLTPNDSVFRQGEDLNSNTPSHPPPYQGGLKVVEAIEQIKDNQYALKFKADQAYKNKPIVLMGVVFGKTERNLVGFRVETCF